MTNGAADSATVAGDVPETWRRLHPLSPLLRGGLALVVIAGIVITNLRDRIVEVFLPDEFLGETGPDEGELIDYIIAEGLIIAVLGAVLGVILLIVLFAWLSWRFRTFRISAEAVEERSGIVFRQHRRAPLERIQSVNLQRPLLARMLGLTQVDVQTAGQGGRVTLRYLDHQQAKVVREQILRATVATRSETRSETEATPFTPAHPAAVPTGQVDRLTTDLDRRAREFVDTDIERDALVAGSLVRVPIGRLVGSILLGWELIVPLVIAIASIVAGIVWMPFAFGLTVPLALIIVSIAVSQFNRGWGFTLSRSADGVRVGAGLTATHTETVPLGRIHAVEARQPLAWRPFGWWRVRITTAGHSVAQGGQNRLQNMVLPVGLIDDVLRVLETVLPAETEPQRDARLDELVGPGTGFLRAGRGAGWVLWFGRRRAGLRIAGLRPAGTERTGTEQRTDVERTGAVEAPLDGLPPEEAATLRIRRGAMTRSLSVMPLVRAQSVQLRRPLVHRMIGLASIQVHTVLGPVRMEMRGIDLTAARDVFEELAAEVVRVQAAETDRRARARDPQPPHPRSYHPQSPRAAVDPTGDGS